MAEKQYLSGNAKEVVFQDGNSLMNVYIDLDDAKEKGLIFKTKSGKNGLAFTIARKSTVGEYGDTHYLYHKPTGGSAGTASKPVAAKTITATAPQSGGTSTIPQKPKTTDDLPF